MNNLIKAINEEIEKRYNENIERINTPEKVTDYLRRINKQYKKNPYEKTIILLRKQADKEIKEQTDKILEISNVKDFSGEFVITVEWIKSKTWGSNPRAYTNTGFESTPIGGCGYDKLSAATAQALNSNNSILKALYEKKNENIIVSNHELLGYGSGHSILPSFEGGVGISSHVTILDGIGLKMQTITSTKNTDIFLITKK